MERKPKNIALGVDIGGSHITAVAVNMDNHSLINESRSESPVDSKAGSDEILGIWADTLQSVLHKVPDLMPLGIGFAMPGPFDYVNGICLIKGVSKYEKLYGVNVGKAIASRLGLPAECKVRFMNDASSFAVGEAWAGKARDHTRMMAITLGTGFGSAFVQDKIPFVEGERVPKMGCVYHLPFGERIADDYFSTRWFIARYSELTGKGAPGVKEIANAALKSAEAKAVFDEFGQNLGRFLSPWLNKFSAEILVIGGNISFAYDLFGPVFEEELWAAGCETQVSISALKEDAALLGSAYLLNEEFWKAVKPALAQM
ncbi:MAG: ROK family protein [Bacteroidia bacterium]|nr:MAG: ROK family protein [Bacteroidia bacterium]